MDARTKAVKTHRTRLKARRMQRVEVTVREHDAVLLRKVASELRRDDAAAQRLRKVLAGATSRPRKRTIAEVFDSLPDVSGPEFDAAFEEIERFRHDPIMMKVRDVEP
jgi:hypothetical protein